MLFLQDPRGYMNRALKECAMKKDLGLSFDLSGIICC